jgi:hypothetical protein
MAKKQMFPIINNKRANANDNAFLRFCFSLAPLPAHARACPGFSVISGISGFRMRFAPSVFSNHIYV